LPVYVITFCVPSVKCRQCFLWTLSGHVLGCICSVKTSAVEYDIVCSEFRNGPMGNSRALLARYYLSWPMNQTRSCLWNSCTLQETSILVRLVGTLAALTVPRLSL
jgi:hypothetical protein